MSGGSKRLFVGIRVAVATANALAGVAETLARRAKDGGVDIRWVASTNYHVTLKFLGNTREDAIAAIRDTLEHCAIASPSLVMKAARLGAFPSLDKARVVWAGVEDNAVLAQLAKRIDEASSKLGFAVEPRPFHGHVTLGRLRETRPVRDVVLPLSEQMFGDTRVDAISLFESETKSSGSVYRELARIAFKTSPNSPSEPPERQSAALSMGTREPDTDDGWPRGHVPNTSD